jgi:hypothetical protein
VCRKPADQSGVDPGLKMVLQSFFEIFRDDKSYRSSTPMRRDQIPRAEEGQSEEG